MELVTVRLNGLKFKAPAHWIFSNMQGEIWGRPESRAGVMRICRKGKLNQKPSLTELEQQLRTFMQCLPKTPVFDIRKPVTDAYLFGGFSTLSTLQQNRRFFRGWYLYRDSYFYLAMYVCPASDYQSYDALNACRDCQRMVLTISEDV
jgi:hypothetical protein